MTSGNNIAEIVFQQEWEFKASLGLMIIIKVDYRVHE